MIKVGILFGGPSREREIAFAGGRTIFDNLDKMLFEPVPIFIDSHKQFILLDWQYIYKGSIRDFYPPVSHRPDSKNGFQVYVESLNLESPALYQEMMRQVGKPVQISELSELIDFAFLSLHGEYGEDGQIQGLLEHLGIPYSGSGIRACAIGMDKDYQKSMMQGGGFISPPILSLSRSQWKATNPEDLLTRVNSEIGAHFVVRPANQGSSIGVSILNATSVTAFEQACNHAFFIERIDMLIWRKSNLEQKISWVSEIADIRSGLGFPLKANGSKIYHPEKLYTYLEESAGPQVILEAEMSEQKIIIEQFIEGREFSCIVLRDEGDACIALPPTEIIKGSEVFDYRSKYLPGLSRKVTPIDLETSKIIEIQKECERLFEFLGFQTYARIDGFLRVDGAIILNDPNTTSGMLPSSFFFHQAAEIGLNPSQFITYIIRTSLAERINTSMVEPSFKAMLCQLDEAIAISAASEDKRKKVGIVLGGYSSERHISVESGRNIFEKLASSNKYQAIPIFGTGDAVHFNLFQIPINLLLKDNADDIRDKISGFKIHPIVKQSKERAENIIRKYGSSDAVPFPKPIALENLSELVDCVFIALHGRPGEDGQLQAKLAQQGIPYNGSNSTSAAVTIDKFATLQKLKSEGFTTTQQALYSAELYHTDQEDLIEQILSEFNLPFILKPVDDGCSSAVKLIKNREMLEAFLALIFRTEDKDTSAERAVLGLAHKEEFPIKTVVLAEELITAKGAAHFLEITGGLLTKHAEDGSITYEIFEPSEALANGAILSLEEKFLAGEGQNITPARFGSNPDEYAYIANQVKSDLAKAAQILDIQGYARIDAFVRVYPDNKVETIIIEVNSLPGMTPATCIFHQCAINGYKPYDFIDNILEFGINQNKEQLVEGKI